MSAAHTVKSAGAAIAKGAEAFGILHALGSIFGAFKGVAPVAEAPALVKGISGIFGYKDERALEVLINKLERDTIGFNRDRNYFKDSREVLTGFFLWHFSANSLDEQALTWWYGNAFRTFLTSMDSDPHKKIVTVTSSESDGKDGKAKEKTIKTTEDYEHGQHAVDFLKMMVKTIKSAKSNPPDPSDLVNGYEKLLRQFKAFGVPHIPGNAHNRVTELTAKLEVVATTLEAKRQNAKPRSLFSRLVRWG